MMNDEQRMRFEEWAEGRFPVEPTYWGHGQSRQHAGYVDPETRGAWAAWQARDAEVQALREELLNYVSADEMAGGEGYGTYPNSEHRRIRALVAGEEGTNHE